MTFFNSLSTPKHEILDFIATIDFENFDFNDENLTFCKLV
jgi:hypothetical protein